MKIKLSDFLEEDCIKRTERLFRITLQKYGGEAALLLKKIILVSMYIQYYQSKTNCRHWIDYFSVLRRNERLMFEQFSLHGHGKPVTKKTIVWHLLNTNGCTGLGHGFFGLCAHETLPKSVEEVEKDIIQYCNNNYKLLINID